MEDSDYTNIQVHVLTKNQTTKKSTKEFFFSKCNTTHRNKCCELQFWRIWQGYTHQTPTVFIACILVLCIPKVLVGGEDISEQKMNTCTWLKRLFWITFVTYSAQVVHAILIQPTLTTLLIRYPQHMHR